MRTFAQKSQATQRTSPAKTLLFGRSRFGQSPGVVSMLHAHRAGADQSEHQLKASNAAEHNPDLSAPASSHEGYNDARSPAGHCMSEALKTKRAINNPADQTGRETAPGDVDKVSPAAGKWAGAAVGALVGGIGGFLVGGPVGAVIGAAGGAAVGAALAAAGPSLGIKNVRGPTAQNCGAYEWVIQWVLSAISKKGGHVVQHLIADYDIKDSAGNDVTVAKMGKKKWNFWEAWPVNAGKKVSKWAEGGDVEDDTYVDGALPGTRGKLVVTGDARFYDGLTTLPSGFKVNNPATQAGILPSTTSDPNLSGGSANVDHDLTVEWDCTSGTSKTKIVSHTP